jgi:hypothetical protein
VLFYRHRFALQCIPYELDEGTRRIAIREEVEGIREGNRIAETRIDQKECREGPSILRERIGKIGRLPGGSGAPVGDGIEANVGEYWRRCTFASL